jgi:nicotinamidase-related amidase
MRGLTNIARRIQPSYASILLDMNTQCDLFLSKGALPVVNRAEAMSNIGRIMSWARIRSVPVVSSLESIRIQSHPKGLPPYCVDRSLGQRKVPVTLLPKRTMVHDDHAVEVSPNLFNRYQQIILFKRARDFLSNPKVDRLFSSISSHHVYVLGAVAEQCVTVTVIRLLAQGHRVAVVTDACGTWDADAGAQAMRQMDARGAVLVSTDETVCGAADERLRELIPADGGREIESCVTGSRHSAEPFCWT